jgi:cyclopropane fatty-acyl-phospholipid synthase-like methyltransferase
MDEREKYEFVWQHSGYRVNSPELREYTSIVETLQLKAEDSVIVFGVGTGKAARRIKDEFGCTVVGLDIAKNCLQETLDDFIVHDLTIPFEGPTYDAGICVDVMEHLPPEGVDTALTNISKLAKRTVFHIPNWGDSWFGQTLHLTVEEPAWWTQKMQKVFKEVKFLGPTKHRRFAWYVL